MVATVLGVSLARIASVTAMAWVLTSCDSGQTPECPEQTCECDCEESSSKPPVVRRSSQGPKPDRGDLRIVYRDTKDPKAAELAARMKEAEVFDRLVAAVNDTIALPRDAAILVADCGRIDAYYEPSAPGVVLCYELMTHFESLFAARIADRKVLERTLTGAVFFAFLHELGHALVHQLELPVTGKEEDAVDQLAAVILISSGSAGLDMALDGARAFVLHSKQGFSGTKFWDEHSFEEQRYYQILCLAYGSNPKQMTKLLGEDGLPKDRAKTCPAEWARVRKAWQALLAPHAKA